MLKVWQVLIYVRGLGSAFGNFGRQGDGIKMILPSILDWAGRTSATWSADTRIRPFGHWKSLLLASI
jgi:hypothetical protein